MAVLTSTELVENRKEYLRAHTDADQTFSTNALKPDINDMMQAIEDWLEGNRSVLSTAIDTGTSPFVFSNADKKKAFAAWCKQKFGRDR